METGTSECKLHYCTLASVLPVGIFRTDVEGHYSFVNEYWCEIAGITAAEAEGNGWVQVLYPEDKERVFAEWYRSAQDNIPFRSEYRVQHADGKTTWVLGQAVTEKDETGTVIGYIGTITDITKYKQAEEELNQYRRYLEELVQERSTELRQANEQRQQERQERAVRVVGSMMDITQRKQAEEQLRSTQEFLAKLLDYTPAPIYIVTADEQRYRLVNRAWEELVSIRREEAIGYSIDELFPLGVTEQFKQVNQQVIDTGTPVIAEEFVDVADGRHYFHSFKFPIQDALGQIEAVAGISLDITERKQAEDALRQSEERFRQMAENIHEVFWMADLELTQMFYVSPAYEAIWGRTCASLYAQPRSFIEAIHPDDRERVLALEQHRQSGFSHEYRIVQPDGSIRWIWEHAFPVRNQAGQLESLVGVSQDISDRKRMEEALRESEQCLRLVLQNMPVMMDALDENWNIIIWNRECEQVTGYSAQEIVNNPKAIELLYPDPDYRQQMIAAWRDRGHDYRNWEWKLTCKDGTVKIISWSNISEQFPIPGWASWGVGVDITDRKQAEEALKQQKELLQTIFDHIPVMVDFYDATGQLKMVNREWERILGWSIDQRPSLDILTELYPDPEYRQFVQDYIVAATGKWGDFKTRVRDGRILDTSWANVRLSDGSCIGIGQDITDRKSAEEALRESEGRFRLLAENSTDMISRHTPEEGIYLYASPACQTLLGYAPEDLVGHSAYEFFHPDNLVQIRRGHVTILDLPVTYTVAYRHRCKDGHYIWLETTCRTIRDQQTAAILEIQSASRDITERKQAEAVLRQQVLREQLIARMTQRIHQSLNLEEILNTTVAEVRQFLECDRVIIYRLESHKSGVVVVESVGSGWRRISGTIINDCYFAENYFQLYQQGRIQALEDIDTADLTPCHVDLLARFQVRANLVVPIVQEEGLWGLLVAQQCSETRQWQPSEIDLLKSLATQSAIAIQKSELYAHSQAEIAQRQQAEVSLQQQFLKERLIAQSAQRIRQSLNLEDILNTTVAEVRQFLA